EVGGRGRRLGAADAADHRAAGDVGADLERLHHQVGGAAGAGVLDRARDRRLEGLIARQRAAEQPVELAGERGAAGVGRALGQGGGGARGGGRSPGGWAGAGAGGEREPEARAPRPGPELSPALAGPAGAASAGGGRSSAALAAPERGTAWSLAISPSWA